MTLATESFEALMAQGVASQAAGKHEQALAARSHAVDTAENPIQRGRALRDVGASHMKLGNVGLGFTTSQQSVDALAGVGPAHRQELYVSQAQLGRFGAFIMAGIELGRIPEADSPIKRGFSSTDILDEAQARLESLEHGSQPHQYRINFEGRRAAAYALEGRRREGAKIAWNAGKLALYSESKKSSTSNENLGLVGRLKAKVAHGVIAAGALAATLAPRRTSLKLIQKVMK